MLRTVLVTGANSGIGLETAVHLARLGFRVVGTVRSEDKADPLAKAASDAGVEVETAVLDVTDRARCEELVTALEPWALVNNAGYMNVGLVVDVPPEEALHQFDTLVVAPMHLASLAVGSMRRRGGGRIVNISSVSAHTTTAMTGWYQACKHALSAVTDALRREVAADGIEVVLIEPGALRTRIWDRAEGELLGRRGTSASPSAYDRSLRALGVLRPLAGEPAAAAEAVGNALTAGRPRARYPVGRDTPVIRVLNVLLPGRVQDRLARRALGR